MGENENVVSNDPIENQHQLERAVYDAKLSAALDAVQTICARNKIAVFCITSVAGGVELRSTILSGEGFDALTECFSDYVP